MKNKKGETVEEKDFMKSLDALENLAKGIMDTGEEDLSKSIDEDDLSKSADGDEDGDGATDTDDVIEKGFPTDDEDEDDDDGDEDVEKSFADSAIEGSETIEKAIEVSDFLGDLVDQVGFALDSIKKSIETRMDSMEKSLSGVMAFNGELAKSLKTSFTEMDRGITQNMGEMDKLAKSFDTLADAPQGRKSLTTFSKSFGESETSAPTTKKDVLKMMDQALEKSIDGITAMDIVRYDSTGELSPKAAKALGMTQ